MLLTKALLYSPLSNQMNSLWISGVYWWAGVKWTTGENSYIGKISEDLWTMTDLINPVEILPHLALCTLMPKQNGCHFPDYICNCIFLNENVWISIKISLKLVPKDPINNIPTLVQIMAWHRPGDKPLSEPMMFISLMHICVTQPQWVKASKDMVGCEMFSQKINQPYLVFHFIDSITVAFSTL